MAQVPSFTYSATVGHLMSAIAKLSAVNKVEAGEAELLLYRGIGGAGGSKLPASFFEADAQGMITAVDAGMMSTSSDKQAALSFFKRLIRPGQPPVLFEKVPERRRRRGV